MERFTPRGMRSTRFIAVYYLSRLPASRNNGSGRKLPLNTLGSVKPCNDASKGEEGGRGGGGSRITCVLQPRIPCVIFNRNRVRQLSTVISSPTINGDDDRKIDASYALLRLSFFFFL